MYDKIKLAAKALQKAVKALYAACRKIPGNCRYLLAGAFGSAVLMLLVRWRQGTGIHGGGKRTEPAGADNPDAERDSFDAGKLVQESADSFSEACATIQAIRERKRQADSQS